MNRPPAFQFYPDKWQSHTRRLSDSGYRVYHELLCWMWQHADDHCSIQDSPEAVACAVAMPLECVRIALAEIQNPFSPLLKKDGERLVSNGLRKEASKQGERRDKAKTSAYARWKGADAMRTHTKQDANASAKQCFPSPSPSPSPNKNKDSEALEIYEAFPLKVGKPKALAAIRKAMEEVPASRLLELTKTFAASRPSGTPFTPHPTTWFNQKRYEDDPATWVPGDLGKTAPPKSSGEFCEGWMNKPASQMTDREALRYVQS